MMINETDQATLDIDWFFTYGNEIGFVASAGGRLPDSVAKSKYDIDKLATYFRGLSHISDIVMSPELDTILAEGTLNEIYLSDFKDMAKKGSQLPLEIIKILQETKISGFIETSLDVESFNKCKA